MKRLFCSFIFLFFAVTAYAYDFSAVCPSGQTLYYNITSDTTVAVTYPRYYREQLSYNSYREYYYYGYSQPAGSVQIPSVVNNGNTAYIVTEIGDFAFYRCSELTEVIMSESITIIGNSAFYECATISSIIFSEHLHSIDNYAFYHCAGLTELLFPDSLFAIGVAAFQGCSNLIAIVFPASLISIGTDAFYYCTGLTELFFPDNLRTIGQESFAYCSNIASIHFPASLISIEAHAFYYCTTLTELFFPDSLSTIGSYAFSYCTNLTELHFPNSLSAIGNSAFSHCTNLTEITLPNSLRYLSGFNNCTSLTEMHLPDSVITIGSSAFRYCTNLISINLPNTIDTIGSYAFFHCDGLSEIHIPDSLCYIGNRAFSNCSGVTGTLNIPQHLRNVGNEVFRQCSGITKVIFPNSLLIIPPLMFSECTGLTEVVFPDSLSTIKSSAFYGCSNLASITIGSGSIGVSAFEGCTNLHKIELLDSVRVIDEYAFKACKNIDTLILGVSMADIGSTAFEECDTIRFVDYSPVSLNDYENAESSPFRNTVIQDIVFGENVHSVPDYLFIGNYLLDTLILPNSVSRIGNHAFENCTHLKHLIIGDSISYIGNNAFCNCVSLADSIYLPSIVELGENAFYGDSIEFVRIGGTITQIGSSAFANCPKLNIRLFVQSPSFVMGNNVFSGCAGIDTLFIADNSHIENPSFSNLPIKYCYLGESSGDFHETFTNNAVTTLHTNLNGGIHNFSVDTLIVGERIHCISDEMYRWSDIKELQLPFTLTSIGTRGFANCTSLKKVIIPDNVQTIGAAAFANCPDIDTLVLGESVDTIASNAFEGCQRLSTIYYNIISSKDYYGIDSFYYTHPVYGSPELRHRYTTKSPFYAICSSLTNLYFGTSVEHIPSYSFAFCETMNCIIPSTVQSIGDYAFYNCDRIIELNGSVKKIGEYAFYGCDRLVNVDIPEVEGVIGTCAFANCMRLKSVTLGNHLREIAWGAFMNCPRLTNVFWGNTLEHIEASAFRDDINLILSDRLPSTLQYIGGGDIIGQGIINNSGVMRYWGGGAFQNCSNIEGNVTIPSEVSIIDNYAFSGCKNISSLTMRPDNPPTIYAHTFDSVNVDIPVYVPCGRILYYYVSDYWENFPNLLEAEPYEVTVSSNDEMMGTAVVDQAPTCSNPRARLSATAQEGYHFIQWSDGNLANPRIVELSSDTAFEAQFAINYISIQVHSSDSIQGSVSGTGRYYYASPVTLTATANNNYHFLHWSDGSTQNPRYMAATHDSTFTAVFASNVSTITIGNNNPDMGTVSGGGVYYYQNYVTFSASPHYGYHFTQWNDGNVANPRTIMVDRDTTFTASFALNLYAVSVNSMNSSMGYVEGTGNYTYNTTIGITATPNYGYHFTQWNDGNTNNPRTIVISKDTMFTAQFAANDYSLSVSSNYPAMGSAYGAGTFNYNTQTTIAASANYGYHFLQWSDGNTENPRVVTVTHNTEYEAQFAPNFYTITTNASNPVCGSASGGGSFNYLSSISIVATPNYGYHFTQWSDGNTDNPRTITVMSNGTYTAQFAINSYAITVAPNNAGRGVVSGSGSYVYNTATTITATPYYGYHFTQWNDGNTENPRTVVITQNAQYTAQFDYNTYQLQTYSNDVTIGNVSGGGTYDFNSMVSVTAIPVIHYHFERWNDSVTDNPRTIVLTRDTSLTALFAIDRHFVDVRSGNSAMGTTSGSGEYNYGASVFISATPNYGYHFVSWADGNTQDPRRIVVENDSVFSALFGINTYTLTTACNDTLMGSVTPSSTYNYNTPVTIAAEPYAGHHFVAWNDGSTDNPRTVVLTCDSSITALFAINTYMLSVQPSDTAMGSVTGSGIYTYHEQVVLTATAREHYHFIRWQDGNTQNPRIVVVGNDSSFVAQFVEDDRYDISVISTDANAGTTTGSGQYYVGTQTYISAVPDEHYLFSRWTDGSVDNPRSITVLGNATYIACFEPKEYEISVFPSNEAMGSVSGGGTFSYGTNIIICAYPSVGHHFVSWNDGDVNEIRTVTVEGTAVYIAEFAEGVGITDETDIPFGISVFPNPTHSTFQVYISGSNELSDMKISVTDLYGRCLLRKKLSDYQTEIDLSSASSGLYFVNILSKGQSIATTKVVKE